MTRAVEECGDVTALVMVTIGIGSDNGPLAKTFLAVAS